MLGWPGSRGGVEGWEGLVWGVAFVETRSAGSLGESGRAGWGVLDWGSISAVGTAPPSPLPSPMEPLFSLVLGTPPPLQLCFQSPVMESWGGSGRRGEVSPLCPFPFCGCLLGSVLLGLHSPLGFSAPSRFSFCLFLSRFLSLLLWLTPSPTPPCRRLARWAGASRDCK